MLGLVTEWFCKKVAQNILFPSSYFDPLPNCHLTLIYTYLFSHLWYSPLVVNRIERWNKYSIYGQVTHDFHLALKSWIFMFSKMFSFWVILPLTSTQVLTKKNIHYRSPFINKLSKKFLKIKFKIRARGQPSLLL